MYSKSTLQMQLIAHRGYWLDPKEKNTETAFVRALQHGFGIETDFRDLNGHLVISHDVPTHGVMLASKFAALYKACPVKAPSPLSQVIRHPFVGSEHTKRPVVHRLQRGVYAGEPPVLLSPNGDRLCESLPDLL